MVFSHDHAVDVRVYVFLWFRGVLIHIGPAEWMDLSFCHKFVKLQNASGIDTFRLNWKNRKEMNFN